MFNMTVAKNTNNAVDAAISRLANLCAPPNPDSEVDDDFIAAISSSHGAD
jgi:hypothetical protein